MRCITLAMIGGLVIFIGEEPHLSGERYAEHSSTWRRNWACSGVRLGGVYGAMPYD